jgi:cellulose synthase/poly-beta-1,6-N-acetylglucosamine synthase-like glycosyltransferase
MPGLCIAADSAEQCSAADQQAHSKSPLLVGLTFGLWLGSIYLLGQRLLPVIKSGEGFPRETALVVFAGLLVTFWLLGSYYLALVIMFVWGKTGMASQTRGRRMAGPAPPVAILYPTCDDFQREAVLTCLAQEYPSFHVFVLDDSSSAVFRDRVDCFQREFPEKVSVVRREARKGYKAGNLNHALHEAAQGFPFFAVMDADERIPPNFLRDMAAQIKSGDYAFVQANHAPNPGQTEPFAKMMGQSILPFWSVLLATKPRYGFVPCVGHGVLIRRSAWEAVGGFPEVASEDLAMSAQLLEKGMRGTFAEDVICHEDFPVSAHAFRKQQQRYVAGVLQVLVDYWPKLLCSRRASWIEKIDFLLCSLPLYVSVLCLLFLVVSGLAIPVLFGKSSAVVANTCFGTFRLPFFQVFDGRFQSMWSPVFVLCSVFLSVSPAFPALALAFAGRIRRPFRLLAVSNLVHMSTMLVACAAVIRFLVHVPVEFRPTGGRTTSWAEGGSRRLSARWFATCEAAFCLLVGLGLFASLNFGYGMIAVCPLLSRFTHLNASHLYASAVIVILGVATQVLLGAALCWGNIGLPPLFFSIHF